MVGQTMTEIQLERYTSELLKEAEQLEKWADESLKGSWSTHQVTPMRERATQLRSLVRSFKA